MKTGRLCGTVAIKRVSRLSRNVKLCVNLKCDPMKADFLRRVYHDVTAGYHMNKEHWNTVTIGGDVPETELYEMIRHSHDLTAPKIRRDMPG